jgi:acetylornithine aminotransferase
MAAAIAVADIIRDEKLMENVQKVGEYLKQNIPASPLIKEVRGKGLMLGIEFNEPVADIRKKLLFEKHIFTGVAGKNMVRLLAPLVLSLDEASVFIEALTDILNSK